MALKEALDFILNSPSVVLTTHEAPDADGLGAEYALAKALRRRGIVCRVINSGPIPEKFKFIDRSGIISSLRDGPLSDEEAAKANLLVLDTSDPRNVGPVIDFFPLDSDRIFFFDHHEASDAAGGPDCRGFVDSAAASTCEMAYLLLEKLGADIELDEAEALFTGISYDTGSFSYQKTGESSFSTALALVKRGVSPFTIHAALHENSSAAALLLMKAAMASLEIHLDGRMSFQTLRRDIFLSLGARYEDAEDLINIPLKVHDMEVSALFKENEEGILRCSLRSKGLVNVAHVAQIFGGGGHKTAAGFKCGSTLDEAKARLLEYVGLALLKKDLPKPGRMPPANPRKGGAPSR